MACLNTDQWVLLSLRHKAGGSNGESILVSQLQHGLTLEFEHSDPLRKLRLTLSELLAIMNKVQDYSEVLRAALSRAAALCIVKQ